MELIIWAVVFIVSLAFLIKGADFFITGAEKIGLSWGLSPFVIGVLLVGIGTSLPEFAGAIAALFANTTEIITANAVGSNIANILLVVGILAVVAGHITIKRRLLDVELPFFVVSTILFINIALDGSVDFLEAALLAAGFLIYIFYLLYGQGDLPVTAEEKVLELQEKTGFFNGSIVLVILGLLGLTFGARFLIESIIAIANIINISPGVVSLTAVALGTSLPELFVSLKAIGSDRIDIAVGNIFGSNAFNILFTVGVPGLFGGLSLDPQTLTLGIPILAAASFIFLVSGIAQKIYRWEGLMFLVFYAFFMLKLFGR